MQLITKRLKAWTEHLGAEIPFAIVPNSLAQSIAPDTRAHRPGLSGYIVPQEKVSPLTLALWISR